MSKEGPNAVLIFPFSDFLRKEWERLYWAIKMLEEAQERLEPTSVEYQLIVYAKTFIREVKDDLEHAGVKE